MTLEVLDREFSVCQVADYSLVDPEEEFCFLAKTDEERSLVCPVELVPANAEKREDGWRAFRIGGALDFSLVGVLARISALLTEKGISIFAVSTYNTDYILTKKEVFGKALEVLSQNGYTLV